MDMPTCPAHNCVEATQTLWALSLFFVVLTPKESDLCGHVDHLFSCSGGRGLNIAALCAVRLHLCPSCCGGEGVEAGWWLAVTCCHRQNNFAAWIFSCGNQTANINSKLQTWVEKTEVLTVWQWSGWSVLTSCSQLESYRSGILS